MIKPKNPCHHNGVDCPIRHIGCHITCIDWNEYSIEQEKYRKSLRSEYAQYSSIDRERKTRRKLLKGGKK